jgi:hypothetical protein
MTLLSTYPPAPALFLFCILQPKFSK